MLAGQIPTWGGDWTDMPDSMAESPIFIGHYLLEFVATLQATMQIRGRKEKWGRKR